MGVEQRKTKSGMVPPQKIAFLSIGLDSILFSKPRYMTWNMGHNAPVD